MLSIEAVRPLNRWDHASIRPGPVGKVGDVLVTPRLKHSAPDLPLRYDPSFSGKKAKRLGSNVSNGQAVGYTSGGGPARTFDTNWGGRRDFKTSRGWIHQDTRIADRTITPLVGTTPDYSWNNKLARTYMALSTGDKFMNLPGPYQLGAGDVPRGGSTPRTVLTQNTGERAYAADPSVGTAFVPPPIPYGGHWGTPDPSKVLPPPETITHGHGWGIPGDQPPPPPGIEFPRWKGGPAPPPTTSAPPNPFVKKDPYYELYNPDFAAADAGQLASDKGGALSVSHGWDILPHSGETGWGLNGRGGSTSNAGKIVPGTNTPISASTKPSIASHGHKGY
jgi:hypothetical protein